MIDDMVQSLSNILWLCVWRNETRLKYMVLVYLGIGQLYSIFQRLINIIPVALVFENSVIKADHDGFVVSFHLSVSLLKISRWEIFRCTKVSTHSGKTIADKFRAIVSENIRRHAVIIQSRNRLLSTPLVVISASVITRVSLRNLSAIEITYWFSSVVLCSGPRTHMPTR